MPKPSVYFFSCSFWLVLGLSACCFWFSFELWFLSLSSFGSFSAWSFFFFVGFRSFCLPLLHLYFTFYCLIYQAYLDCRFSSIILLCYLRMHIGCWRMYVVLVVTSTMEWHCGLNVIQAFRPNFLQSPMFKPFWRDKTPIFCVRVWRAPDKPRKCMLLLFSPDI